MGRRQRHSSLVPLLAFTFASLSLVGCAGVRAPVATPSGGASTPATTATASPAEPGSKSDQPTTTGSTTQPAPTNAAAGAPTPAESRPETEAEAKQSAWVRCAQPPAAGAPETRMETTRRLVHETTCAANLWLDGLFGGEGNAEVARQVSGRVELYTEHSDYEGVDLKARFNVRARIPNLDKRVDAFLGRDDFDDFVQDRRETLFNRSPFADLEGEDRWLAGFGYSLPDSDRSRTDFRLGAKLRSAPEIFTQGRLRYLAYVDEINALRLRETAFWTNRQGWGFTSNADYDRVLSQVMLFRWSTAGTWSEESEGLDWRSAVVLYHNLLDTRATAYELFIRGATDAPVGVREYGGRAVYRQSVFYRWLFGEIVVGYTWPRERLDEHRDGSLTIGFGIEMLFGRDEL